MTSALPFPRAVLHGAGKLHQAPAGSQQGPLLVAQLPAWPCAGWEVAGATAVPGWTDVFLRAARLTAPLQRSRSAFSSGKLRGTATGLSASHYTQESSPAPATPAWGERWVPELWVPTQLCPQGHFSGRVRDGFSWRGSWAPPSSPVRCPRCRRVGWAPRQRAQGHRAVTVSGGCGRAQRLSVSACKPIPE